MLLPRHCGWRGAAAAAAAARPGVLRAAARRRVLLLLPRARVLPRQPFVIDCAFVDGGTRLVVATTKGSVAKFDLAALLAGAPDAAVATHALVQGANAPALAVSHGAGRVLALSARSGMTVRAHAHGPGEGGGGCMVHVCVGVLLCYVCTSTRVRTCR